MDINCQLGVVSDSKVIQAGCDANAMNATLALLAYIAVIL